MVLKFNNLSWSSSSGDQPQPPFGAPTGHFGDVTDNIQREALAATNDLGQAIFGADLGGAAHTPGDPVTLQPAGDVTSADVNQLKTEFAQLVYDAANPVETIRMTNSTSGRTAADILNPSGLTATWSPCDGGTYNSIVTPDYRGKVIYGADPLGISVHAGDAVAENAASSFTGLASVDGHDLSLAEMPYHRHAGTGLTAAASWAGGSSNHAHTVRTGDNTNFVTTGNNYFVGDAGNTVQHQDKTTGRTGTAAAAGSDGAHSHAVTGNTAYEGGSGGVAQEHTHDITDVEHDHAGQLPAGVAAEFWIRTA